MGFYPGPAYAHWFSELQPVAGYWLMYPWVAEVALDPVLETLGRDGVRAIVRVRPREVKGHDPQGYLHPLFDYLDENLAPAGDGVYRSPALAAECPQ